MARSLVFTRAAARAFRRMPQPTEDLIRDKLRRSARDPDSLANDVKALKGPGDRWSIVLDIVSRTMLQAIVCASDFSESR